MARIRSKAAARGLIPTRRLKTWEIVTAEKI
jgi:hypothetical protein